MTDSLKEVLKESPVAASAPCRIDMGGTLDIGTFSYPLRHLDPCTFNIAIDLRTTVKVAPYLKNLVRVSSVGFESAEYPLNEAPFDHPLGLMFAISAFFNAGGIHIRIDSSSPPRSALGGSSSAAVALIAAFSEMYGRMGKKRLSRREIALLAHFIEAGVAGCPCGIQDQLAAVYGGVNAWRCHLEKSNDPFERKVIVHESQHNKLESHLLLAYTGVTHSSADINGKWVRQFMAGENRDMWTQIVSYTKGFIDAVSRGYFDDAVLAMNAETSLRRKMTPEVLDDIGLLLIEAAEKNGCGARFTGAGGGGCIWALGKIDNIDRLKEKWEAIFSNHETARILDVNIDNKGLSFNH